VRSIAEAHEASYAIYLLGSALSRTLTARSETRSGSL
jgi:hypothetical protein